MTTGAAAAAEPNASAAAGAAAALHAEARRADERRLLVCAGDRAAARAGSRAALDAASIPMGEATVVAAAPRDVDAPERDALPNAERLAPPHTTQLLGTTRSAIVLDLHDGPHPNALGRCVGAVDGGGLLVLCTPPLGAWPDRAVPDDPLAVPPHGPSDVGGRFVERLAETLRAHRGVGIVDCDAGRIVDAGLTDPPPAPSEVPAGGRTESIPPAAAQACRTADQRSAVETLVGIGDDCDEGAGRAIVLESDRGRGKTAAVGVAAACLAADGADVCVTAPDRAAVDSCFERVLALRAELADGADRRDDRTPGTADAVAIGTGRVRFAPPDAVGDPDVLFVDEAAALPVPRLEDLLAADRVGFASTVHGYEGAGRGFDVRFRDRLADGRHAVTDCTLSTPIRHAPADPIEVWSFRSLALGARPAAAPLVADARPESTTYHAPNGDALAADEHRLNEAFGLLVDAHYRTEPADLRRLLDAPNIAVRTLEHGGHVAGVALLAFEGGLDPGRRERLYVGDGIRGHLLPDLLTSQLRDPDAAGPFGVRIVRIAIHPDCRRRGLGSRLLEAIRGEFQGAGGDSVPPSPSTDGDPSVDWLGTAFGATPDLLRFWTDNGFRTVTVGTTRNDRSGRHAAVLLDPLTDAGNVLHDRHARRFRDRLPSLCAGPLSGVSPDVLRAALAGVDPAGDDDAALRPSLADWEWRTVVGAAYGPGLIDVTPGPFRRLAIRALIDDHSDLTDRQERLLVRRVLQFRSWMATADALDYPATGRCRRAACDAFRPLVDRYGTRVAHAERERLRTDP